MPLPEKPNCLWITDADFIEAETFLLQSLTDLQLCSNVLALSGGTGKSNKPAQVKFSGFARAKMTVWRTIIKKAIQIDLIELKRKRQAKKILTPIIQKFKPDFAWIHFGTTVDIIQDTLNNCSIPYFIQVHGVDVTSKFSDNRYKSSFVDAANNSINVICSSEHIRRLCILEGVRPDIPIVVKNALDIKKIDHIVTEKDPQPSFVHLGRLTAKKHPLATLHAFALVHKELPESTLTFIGRGDLEGELRKRTAQLGLTEAVEFKGAMSHNQALTETSRHWIFCQHSVTARNGDQEGFANSIAEAGLMEIPCVSTRHNGIPEHVLHGITGMLVAEHDYEEMAKYMLLLATDHEMRTEMGKRARAHYEGLYHPTIRAAAIKDVISQLDN